jgi:hypothetical protein
MCGITGFLTQPNHMTEAGLEALAADMADAIRRRGPDSQGTWSDPEAGIAFGHLRLAIIDLSPAGHQPMAAPSGRYVICYNGEIYNHLDLRAELEESGNAPAWRGHSDTETLVAGFDAWGIEPTIARAVGMFAIAVWDRQERVLTLIRDRMGEKPLYFGWQGTGPDRAFLFGSELAALRRHPAFEGEIERAALVQLLRHGYVGEELAIHRGLSRVQPGEMVEISHRQPEPRRHRYWDGADIAADDPAPRHQPRGRGRGIRDPAAQGRGAADDVGRAPRRVPVGRGRFLGDRGLDGASVRPPRAHLLHRLPREALQRSRIRQGDRGASGDRSHRALRRRHRAARGRPATAAALGRTLCRQFADPDLPGGQAGPRACHRRAVGRWRRRASVRV